MVSAVGHQLAASCSELAFNEKLDFYRHAGKWSNRMIMGDPDGALASVGDTGRGTSSAKRGGK